MCGIKTFGIKICAVIQHRVKTLCWNMPSFQDFLITEQVLKGRHIPAWGFNPMNWKRHDDPMNWKRHDDPVNKKRHNNPMNKK